MGGTDRQQQLDEEYHPTATFIGGMLPYLLTMRPGGFGAADLPANASAWEQITKNPIASRLFAGGLIGGMEFKSKSDSGQPVNWQNVAIATGFGLIFNKPTRFGQSIEHAAEAVVPSALRTGFGTLPTERPALPVPTVAQAADANIIGPGNTEGVFQGTEVKAPAAQASAENDARTEADVLNLHTAGQPGPPDVGQVAREREPELFRQYDALGQQQADIQAHRDNMTVQPTEPGAAEMFPPLPEVQSYVAQLDRQIQTIDAQRAELAPQVSAAYRRAADAVGAGVVEPVPQPAPSPAPATEQGAAAPATGEAPAPSPAGPISPQAEEQSAAIASSIAQQFIAAGRPADEAQALGRVEAARIVQRSRRMNGALGNPLDLYNAQGADIRAGGASRAPVPAVEAEPAIDPAAARATAESTGQAKLIEKLIGRGASNKEIADTIGRKLSENEVAAFRTTVAPKPPLMPTAEQPEIGRPAEMAQENAPLPPDQAEGRTRGRATAG